jgi:hypothetical protein
MNPFLLDFLITSGINSGLYALAILVQNPSQAAIMKTTISHFVDSACALYGWQVTRP